MADIDIGQISEALNDKTDRDFNNMNPSSLSKETIVSWSMPDYDAGVAISLPYTCPTDGYVRLTHGASTNAYATYTISGQIFQINNDGAGYQAIVFPVAKGDIVQLTAGSVYTKTPNTFYPTKRMAQ